MAKARSPGYPSIGLKEAIDRIGEVWKKDYQNKIPRPILASHMGYSGLSGKSLGVLSSLGKFGLLEGRGDENWVSDLAVSILAHPPKTEERIAAIKTAASTPNLFSEIDLKFQNGKASDQAIKSWLITQKFLPPAADVAVRSYRETKELVEEKSTGYDSVLSIREAPIMPRVEQVQFPAPGVAASQSSDMSGFVGMRKAVFALSEGDVVLSFPDDLSPESVTDLEDYLGIFLKKARREAGIDPKKN